MEICHALETALAERGGEHFTEEERRSLADAWGEVRARVGTLVFPSDRAIVELALDEHEQFVLALEARHEHARLLETARAWRLEPAAGPLAHAAEQAQGLARRLDRPQLDVQIEHGWIRLEPRRWAPFWSALTHVVRNAIDHGLEPAGERLQAGKPAEGRLSFRLYTEQDGLWLEVTDDGRGVDWEKVAARARVHGLPHETRDELQRALFADGLSTRAQATEISGRGVGMSAVLRVTEEMGGRVEVDSVAGRGTTVRFCFSAALDASPPKTLAARAA